MVERPLNWYTTLLRYQFEKDVTKKTEAVQTRVDEFSSIYNGKWFFV